jgi:hypothetical protein
MGLAHLVVLLARRDGDEVQQEQRTDEDTSQARVKDAHGQPASVAAHPASNTTTAAGQVRRAVEPGRGQDRVRALPD